MHPSEARKPSPFLWLWLAISLNIFANHASAQTADLPALGFTPVANAFPAPTSITHAGDGSQRLFVEQRGGQIRVITNSTMLSQPFLDISNRVLSTGFEQGLLGLAFPPGYSTNAHFYVDYTRQPDGAVVISRFSLTPDPNIADTNSEQVILVIPKTYNNHNGGQLAFGPDGYLYIGVGDGGSELDPDNRGQDPRTPLGKLLRIDVESGTSPYAIPTNNPFVGNTNYAPEIWALGLRNPWRFSFDRATGDLYIGDVGQGFYEEVDFQAAGSAGGQNYGWRIMEGPTNFNVPAGFTNFSSLTLPITSYDHASLPTDLAAAITGGYVYRGPTQPRMDGMYFFGDFMAGSIWGLKRVGTNWQRFELMNAPHGPSTFGEDEQGRLYLADYNFGTIYQIYDTHQAWAPVFSPLNGIINSNTVVVTCMTPGAEIHYTTNGVDPTLADPIVASGGMISVMTAFTNKARAFRSDLSPSAVARATFTNKVGTPYFSPPSGGVTNGALITIGTVTPGATIYYTSNGLPPTTNSALYSGPLRFAGNSMRLLALGVAPGYSNSAVATGLFPLAQVAAPVFSPDHGPLARGSQISISCATPGATIYYTVNGPTPTTNSPVYSSPIPVTGAMGLQAMAAASNYANSFVPSLWYDVLGYDHTVVTTFAGSTTAGFSNAPRALARFSAPEDVCFDPAGNLYVADWGNNVIRKVAPSGLVTTFAGSGTNGYLDGPATNAQFSGPSGICVDQAGNFYIAESPCGNWRVRKIDSSGTVSTLATTAGYCTQYRTLDFGPDGNLYVGDASCVQEIFPTGTNSIIAGNASGWTPTVGIAVDSLTNIFAATENRVWKIAPGEPASVFAGGPTGGFSDGQRLLARFEGPLDTAVDSGGNVYVADRTAVRKISSDGTVSSLGGKATSGFTNGRGIDSQFGFATGVCVDTTGNIYVADSGNNCIRKISPDMAGIGIADDWQLAHFGSVGIDPNDDPDHDGMSNFAEFWAGTDPVDPDSALAISSISIATNGFTQIAWHSVPGKTYTVQYSNDLKSWNTVASSVQAADLTASITDPTPALQTTQRFYRVSVGF